MTKKERWRIQVPEELVSERVEDLVFEFDDDITRSTCRTIMTNHFEAIGFFEWANETLTDKIDPELELERNVDHNFKLTLYRFYINFGNVEDALLFKMTWC